MYRAIVISIVLLALINTISAQEFVFRKESTTYGLIENKMPVSFICSTGYNEYVIIVEIPNDDYTVENIIVTKSTVNNEYNDRFIIVPINGTAVNLTQPHVWRNQTKYTYVCIGTYTVERRTLTIEVFYPPDLFKCETNYFTKHPFDSTILQCIAEEAHPLVRIYIHGYTGHGPDVYVRNGTHVYQIISIGADIDISKYTGIVHQYYPDSGIGFDTYTRSIEFADTLPLSDIISTSTATPTPPVMSTQSGCRLYTPGIIMILYVAVIYKVL